MVRRSVLSLEGGYYNYDSVNYDSVTTVIRLISPSQSRDNFFITCLCFYQASNKENTGTRSECVFHGIILLSGTVYQQQKIP